MNALLEIEGLTKIYRTQWTFRQVAALDNLSLTIGESEVFGLIGPNGAGKTTSFKLLLGMLRPTRGRALLRGFPSTTAWARQQIGFLPEQPYFYDYLSVRETLEFYARLCRIPAAERRSRLDELIEQLHLGPKLNAPMRSLSKGTLQRVGVAQAIINRPQLVILDEPMSGLDPAGRKQMRDLIQSLKHRGATVIFSSHILPDAEALCDRVGILAGGRLREIVDLAPLDGKRNQTFLLTISGVAPSLLQALQNLACEPARGGPETWTLTIAQRERVRHAVQLVQECGAFLEGLSPVEPSLEERFLTYVGGAHAPD
jgi:ABC-2 type transport system ATP-binding protein